VEVEEVLETLINLTKLVEALLEDREVGVVGLMVLEDLVVHMDLVEVLEIMLVVLDQLMLAVVEVPVVLVKPCLHLLLILEVLREDLEHLLELDLLDLSLHFLLYLLIGKLL
jgi:hypothetical protein